MIPDEFVRRVSLTGMEYVDKGMDSVVVRNGGLVRHYYPYATYDQLAAYQCIMDEAYTYFRKHPIIRRLGGYTVGLRDVVPVTEVYADEREQCYFTEAPVLDGPHLSAFYYQREQFELGVMQLHDEERYRLRQFRSEVGGETLFREMEAMLQLSGRVFKAHSHAKGVQPSSLNTKVRSFSPGQINLVLTDICPVLDQLEVRHGRL